jgi:NADPH2:quinone reductase
VHAVTPADTIDQPTVSFVLSAFGPPEVMVLRERPTRAPGPGEVLIDVEAAGVNFGDTMIRRGEYLRNQPLSMAPGCEAVGRVGATGDGVDLPIGSRVSAWIESGGAYANRVIAPTLRTYPVPDEIPAAAIAAITIQGITAHYAVHRFGEVQSGETVLIHAAAGGLGGLAVQLAKLAGARVVGTASNATKRDRATDAGADATLDSSDPDGLAAKIREATDGRGPDLVVDGVGGPLFAPSLRSLARRGRYVVVGSSTQQPAMLDVRHLLPRSQMIRGFIVADVATVDSREPGATLTGLCELVAAGELRPRYEVVALERAPEVHRRIEDRTLTGKVVLVPS